MSIGTGIIEGTITLIFNHNKAILTFIKKSTIFFWGGKKFAHIEE